MLHRPPTPSVAAGCRDSIRRSSPRNIDPLRKGCTDARVILYGTRRGTWAFAYQILHCVLGLDHVPRRAEIPVAEAGLTYGNLKRGVARPIVRALIVESPSSQSRQETEFVRRRAARRLCVQGVMVWDRSGVSAWRTPDSTGCGASRPRVEQWRSHAYTSPSS